MESLDSPKPPTQPSLELVLAQQANDAMKRGADPQKATAMLGTMLKHIRANPDIGAHGADAIARGADPGQVAHQLWGMANAPSAEPKPAAEKPGVIGRAGEAIKQGLLHPIDTAVGAVKAAGQSAFDTFAAPVIGEVPGSDLAMIHGTDKPVTKDTPNAITPKRQLVAAAQTVANVAVPSIAGGVTRGAIAAGVPRILSRIAGSTAAGATAGAASAPEDPAAGALAGAALGPAYHGAAKLTGRLAAGIGHAGIAVAGKALDVVGRPAESGSFIEGTNDRAARLNSPALKDVTPPGNVNKPLATVDLSPKAMRLARGLKTSSAAAEQVIRDALQPRAEGSVDRVIQHGLETTGLASRENGLGVVDDMIARRADEAGKRYPATFSKYANPIDDPEFHDIAQTPAGQQALKRGMTIAANRGEKIGTVMDETHPPAGIAHEDWLNIQRLAQERGMELPQLEGDTRIAPTLKQAHYVKLGFDDMLNSAPEPGSGGSGPNNAAAVRGLKSRWLAAMDQAAPEYADDRKTYADHSDLIDAAKLGRNLFKLHPQEAAKAMQDLPQAARDVARRTGFDALAERIENGPGDVAKGASKPRDQARMRLLFPDDASFDAFKQGLAQEAQMHATTQDVLGGSNTADKFADMARMAGVTLPEVLHAATGRVMPMVRGVATRVLRKAGSEQGEKLAAARAKLLVAGADGDATARTEALGKMRRLVRPQSAP